MEKMLKKLEKYFENTSKEKIEKEWEKIKQWNEIGPDAIEYCNMIKKQFYKHLIKTINKHECKCC